MKKSLIKEPFESGKHSVRWDGNDDTGKRVSSGIYLYKIKAGKQKSVKRMLLLKWRFNLMVYNTQLHSQARRKARRAGSTQNISENLFA